MVGRRGARPARQRALRGRPRRQRPGRSGPDRAVPELRHGGVPQLRPVRVRRRQLAFPVGPGAAEGPSGSGQIEALFHNYFRSQELASDETPFSGRSDYGPFIAEGIPAGGLFTGAEGLKTAAQAAIYGGQAGVAYDHCYHADCDDFGNVNMDAIDEMSDAMAHAVYTYALDASSVIKAGDGGKAVRGSGTGELRRKAHDYDAPNHHVARR